MSGLLHSERCASITTPYPHLDCDCMPPIPVEVELMAMSPDEKSAMLEFREAAREARATAAIAQKAAQRYAAAVKRLSEVTAPAPAE